MRITLMPRKIPLRRPALKMCDGCGKPSVVAKCWCLKRLCENCRLGEDHADCIEDCIEDRKQDALEASKAILTPTRKRKRWSGKKRNPILAGRNGNAIPYQAIFGGYNYE